MDSNHPLLPLPPAYLSDAFSDAGATLSACSPVYELLMQASSKWLRIVSRRLGRTAMWFAHKFI